VKFVFSLALLINITFFLWEYRKGAPDIYLPTPIEYSTIDTQKIILLNEPPAIPIESNKNTDTAQDQLVTKPEQQLDTDNEIGAVAFVGPRQLNASNQSKLSDTDSKIAATSEFVGPVYQQPSVIQEYEFTGPINEQSPKLIETDRPQGEQQADTTLSDAKKNTQIQAIINANSVVACYQLTSSATKTDFISQTDKKKNYTLTFAELQVPYITNYIVLTLPAETFQLAQNTQKTLKQQGIKDLWMFKKGIFKWRISLGIFSSLENAGVARNQYAKLTTESLDVVPSWKSHTVTQVTISAQQEQDISVFEQRFSNYINKDLDCL